MIDWLFRRLFGSRAEAGFLGGFVVGGLLAHAMVLIVFVVTAIVLGPQ